ncbi:DNA-entry nuclease [Paenibacillus sp. FSL R5-0345]|uniref:NucA/NucB deoxyribonuclease domain-containing protein n=1 Tax=Paenibacillus sp. FSL R5-0345 TaxID=1536770 RepID=UPI0004F6E920|nr:NucA/NucB deoxyribonuclease domain-containing protein [Paenibacillus sp. FSL R5-0345]AIQ37216.1 DNA-entry nuclease [Paenibacillus sp. FSL R5-0345]
MKTKKLITSLIIVVLLVLGSYWFEQNGDPAAPSSPSDSEVVQLIFPSDRYPETAKHIQDAIAKGESATCTINREQAEENRKESLRGIPTKKGYDRDEWPMAMCDEGGEGADIEYITPKDNRGAGSWVGNQLEDYADGTRVEFMFK